MLLQRKHERELQPTVVQSVTTAAVQTFTMQSFTTTAVQSVTATAVRSVLYLGCIVYTVYSGFEIAFIEN